MLTSYRIQQSKRWLLHSPAFPNDYIELELSGAWEPLDSSSPSSNGEGKETQFGLPYGNQTKQEENGVY
jgi:hypothetical protein